MNLLPCILVCAVALSTIADAPAADAVLVAAAPPPAITLPRAVRKGEPPPKVPTPAIFGQRAEAKIAVGNKTHSLHPNQVGSFGRIFIGPKAKADIEVAYPNGKPSEVVMVQPMDGGRVGDKLGGHKLELDKQGKLRFQFEANEESGIYRVMLRKRTDIKMVEFWVGEPLPISERRKPEIKESK